MVLFVSRKLFRFSIFVFMFSAIVQSFRVCTVSDCGVVPDSQVPFKLQSGGDKGGESVATARKS